MKTVFIKSRFNGIPIHSLYYELQRESPLGYKIIIPESKVGRFSTSFDRGHNQFYKAIMYYFGSIPYIIYQLNSKVAMPENVDLIFAAEHVISSAKPWIVGLEFVGSLSVYTSLSFTKGIISKKLKDRSCKKILAYSEWGKRTILNSFGEKEINDKIEVVRYTVSSKKVEKNSNNEKIRVLFVGTSNPANEADFEYKGIYEVINAFVKLQKEYSNKIELVIRSKISHNIRQMITGNQGITLIENILTKEELENLYLSCDIFPQVGYGTITLAVLEAMSYGLPVIVTNIFNNSELVRDNENGILIKLPNIERFYSKNELPNEHSLSYLKIMRSCRTYVSEKLVESLRLLIEDKKLRLKIGMEAKKTIDDGEFSVKKRNALLEKIFDEST